MKARNIALATAGLVAIGATNFGTAHGDPCGMVPPMRMIQRANSPIERVGAQKTFVFHSRGVETMVLRPGFKGKVDNFGMLIPFPSVPAIRKVDDNIFPHVAAAIDPPEITAWVRRYRRRPMSKSAPSTASRGAKKADSAEAGLGYNQVKVLRKEAVGMYEVAVLAAGSSNALKRWMDRHGFKYPKGMDVVVDDYVKSRWVFVAVKTKVAQKAGLNPRPGMRKVKSKLPAKSVFSGNVQAMGFRFKTKRLVVPMRLSAFNKGKLRNVVYVLTDGPRRINNIPRRFVVRQLTGAELYNNVTKPLPLRVIGGTYDQLNQWQKQNLKTRRNPTPFNGLAKNLFASDLMAVKAGRLSNPDEEKEKRLLAIGEALGLRGKEIDAEHNKVLATVRAKAATGALARLKDMTLTIVDGDFEREVIAKQNLTFRNYRMAKFRNNRIKYDATRLGPGTPRAAGKVYHGALDINSVSPHDDAKTAPWKGLAGGIGFGAGLFLVGFAFMRRRNNRSVRKSNLTLVVLIAASVTAASVFGAGVARAELPSYDALTRQLKNPKQAQRSVDRLVRRGPAAVDEILDFIADDRDMEARGWAIVALSKIGGSKADRGLTKLQNNATLPKLVRTWAAAGRIRMAKSPKQLLAMANMIWQLPAIKRPLGLRLVALLQRSKGRDAAEHMLDAIAKMPQIAPQIQSAVMRLGSRQLVGVMIRSKNNNARRMAASYLGAMARKPNNNVAASVVRAYRFRRNAKKVPWDGGALFVPGMQWDKQKAQQLVAHLIRWHVWSDVNQQTAFKNQIHNNLRSLSLARMAGYRSPGWRQITTEQWLRVWGQVVGKRGIRKILREQRATKRYKSALDSL